MSPRILVVDDEPAVSDLLAYNLKKALYDVLIAAEKVRALAKAVGAEAGCALSINENTSSYNPNNWWWYGANNRNLQTQNTVQNAAPPVSPGQISVKAEVKAEVNVSFELK